MADLTALVDLVGKANAQWLRASAGERHTDVHGVPCVSFDIDAPWATQAALTERAQLPAELDDVLGWLERARPGYWQVRVRAEQTADPALAGLASSLELGVWITDRRPAYALADGAEIGEARDAEEFLGVFGKELAPLLDGQLGAAGRSFLVLRVHGETVGCARVTRTGDAAYVSGIVVRPDWRGHGYGLLMSAAAVDRAVHEAGLAWLHCEDSLTPLYQQVGLRRLTTHVDLGPPAA